MARDEWVASGTKQVCRARTLARTPAESDLQVHVCRHGSPPFSEEMVYSGKVKHGDRSPIILQTDDSGFRGQPRFFCRVFEAPLLSAADTWARSSALLASGPESSSG